ncbi:MAG: xylulokinase [Ruminococcaceae bacterium]|nr:xylulokinase [Oscillospiraceae bacterium]
MTYLLGIDFGGGASKATLIGADGRIVAEHTVEYPTLHPTPAACEQNPEDWIAALCENAKTVLKKAGIAPREIAAVAVDSATHTSLVCDGDCRPLRPAMHWTDSRSRREAELLREQHGEEIFEKTFHKPDTIWTLPQLLWLRENEPEVFSRIRHVFFEKDYIRYFLTDIWGTDEIEAEGSMLFDCRSRTWDAALCALCGIDPAVLPPICRPTDVVGGITAKAAAATGLAEGTPVVCGTTDTVLEVLASGAVERGDMTVKLATAGRICVITDRPHPDRHLVNYSHVAEGLWYPGTATKAAASAFRFYRDTFGGDYRQLDEEAEATPLGAEGLLFHPYINGELTPYADPLLCGSFTGIRATHTRGHFTRAVLEGVALSLLDSKRYLDGLQIPHGTRATLIGGGAKSPLWAQITADVLGTELDITESSDSSLGAAMLAGIAIGVFDSPVDAVKKCIRKKRTVLPDAARTEQYAALFEKYKKIHDALAPIYHEI